MFSWLMEPRSTIHPSTKVEILRPVCITIEFASYMQHWDPGGYHARHTCSPCHSHLHVMSTWSSLIQPLWSRLWPSLLLSWPPLPLLPEQEDSWPPPPAFRLHCGNRCQWSWRTCCGTLRFKSTYDHPVLISLRKIATFPCAFLWIKNVPDCCIKSTSFALVRLHFERHGWPPAYSVFPLLYIAFCIHLTELGHKSTRRGL